MPDPNWFYSSLAQCAAAVVGLLGAVLATRLQQQLNDVRESHQSAFLRLEAFGEEVEGIRTRTRNCIPVLNSNLAKISDARKKGENLVELPEVQVFGGTPPSTEGGISMPAGAREEQAAVSLLNLATSIADELDCHRVSTLDDVRSLGRYLAILSPMMPTDGQRLPVDYCRDRVSTVIAEIERHMRVASIQLAAILACVLGWICAFGLIAPLLFLSASHLNWKWVMLIMFGLGVSAIPAYVGYQVWQIQGLKHIVLPE